MILIGALTVVREASHPGVSPQDACGLKGLHRAACWDTVVNVLFEFKPSWVCLVIRISRLRVGGQRGGDRP